MRLITFPSLIQALATSLALLCRTSQATVTFKDIRSLTNSTWDVCGRVDPGRCAALTYVDGELDVRYERDRGLQQPLLASYDDEKDDVELAVTAALKMLNADIVNVLNQVTGEAPGEQAKQCIDVVTEYHDFIDATVHFLSVVNDKQAEHRWPSSSTIFDEVGYLQALWASRRTNKLHLSFIEQQQDLYKPTSCFRGDLKDEVVYRGVEIVEFLNDMLDSFETFA